ncbi:MAG: hypothetical protein ACRERE_14170 [Candidatus Entotheonellia bacterium]
MDAHGKPLCTLQALAAVVGSANRHAASQHLEDCRQCGEDVRTLVRRMRKGDATVVEAVWAELLHTPLVGPTELVPRVQAPLGRAELRVANIECALAQISGVPVLRTLRWQLEAGPVQDQEAARRTELLEQLSAPGLPYAGGRVPSPARGRRLAQVSASRGWLTVLLTLFDWHVPLAVLGRWGGVHQTTILRWVVGLALSVWPVVCQWLVERVMAPMVYVDEKWLKRRGRWHYGFVVVDVTPERPVGAALLPSRSPWACRGLGAQLHRLKQVPRVLITDGLQAYASLGPGATHVWWRVHHQQGVTHWLKQHCTTEAESNARKPVVKRLLQPYEKRTVRRRLAQLREQAPELGITPWLNRVAEKLPALLGSVGSRRRPSTTTAIARFFRAFERFYQTRQGFHSVLSAKRALRLFFVG